MAACLLIFCHDCASTLKPRNSTDMSNAAAGLRHEYGMVRRSTVAFMACARMLEADAPAQLHCVGRNWNTVQLHMQKATMTAGAWEHCCPYRVPKQQDRTLNGGCAAATLSELCRDAAPCSLASSPVSWPFGEGASNGKTGVEAVRAAKGARLTVANGSERLFECIRVPATS